MKHKEYMRDHSGTPLLPNDRVAVYCPERDGFYRLGRVWGVSTSMMDFPNIEVDLDEGFRRPFGQGWIEKVESQ